MGSFVRGLLAHDTAIQEIVGLELQPRYVAACGAIAHPAETRLTIVEADIFRTDLARDVQWQGNGPLLIVGNPPWVTNAAQGALDVTNLPRKSNFKGMRGIDAITGHANFDIAEYIWLKLLTEFRTDDVTISLLCKTSVARKVLCHAHDNALPLSAASIRKIDAARWFGAAVDACLFTITLNHCGQVTYEAPVFASLGDTEPVQVMGIGRNGLVADVPTYESVRAIDGRCPIQWRQGVKHDAAQVVELVFDNGIWRNGLGETIDVEEAYIYPLVKSADLGSNGTHPKRGIIITQMRVGESTSQLQRIAPRLWSYLTKHADIFRLS